MNKSAKILTGVVILLALGLVVETAFLFNKNNPTKIAQANLEGKHKALGWQTVQPQTKSSVFDRDLGFWDPSKEMEQIQARMNRMFRESLGRSKTGPDFGGENQSAFFEPDVDISEKDNHYLVKLDLPGMEKDKINVEVQDRLLTISGERKVEKEETKEGSFYKMERSFGSFYRSIPLPDNANGEAVTAEYKNGVMTITIPKIASPSTVQKQGTKIEVR